MESNLRPLSLGEILDRTAQLYREHFLLFAGIYSVYAGMVLVLNLAQIGLNSWAIGPHPAGGLLALRGVVSLLRGLLILLFSGAAMAAINRAVTWVYLGNPVTIRGAYMSILPHLGRYLWLMIIIAFFLYTPLLLVGILFGVVIAASPGLVQTLNTTGNPQSATAILMIFLILALVLLPWIVYVIFMALRYSLAVPACVVENLKARKAIRRSIELSKGARGRIFLMGLLIFIIAFGLEVVAQSFLVILAIKHKGQIGPVALAVSQVMAFFTNTFIGPIYAAGLALFYFDQRVRKEGYDIEWMMQAAGLAAPDTPQVPQQNPGDSHE
ncbi:MAG TPA: hypothetical protein VGE85_13875 [Terracidiphilus sp.]|jgi:hypothetical protein